MRKVIATLATGAAALTVGATVAPSVASAATTVAKPKIVRDKPSHADPLNLHAGQPGGPLATPRHRSAVPGVSPNTVPVSGNICNGHTGGNCWWETAVQFWYNMKNGTNEKADLDSVYSEYGGDFQDGWTDDDAWWGITFELAYQKYGESRFDTKANNLWTYDTTTGWDSDCGGSTLQHSGGSQNDISRAALGVLASVIGQSGSAGRAADWIYAHLQGSVGSNPASEGLNTNSSDPCSASSQDAELGGQTESWKIENLTGGSGQTGTRSAATADYPDSDYNGQFNLLYQQYIQ